MKTFIHSNLPFDGRERIDESFAVVYLSNCALARLPALHSYIRVLDVSCNQIEEIEALRQLRDLENLDCSHTHIANIAPLLQSKTLKRLNLSCTQIPGLEPLGKMTQLAELQLDECGISDSAIFKNLKNLRHLSLAHNSLANGEFIKLLSALSTCNLGYNAIESFDVHWCGKSLVLLYLDGNPLDVQKVARDTQKKCQFQGKLFLKGQDVTCLTELLPNGAYINGTIVKNSATDGRKKARVV